jgi:glutamine synthetase
VSGLDVIATADLAGVCRGRSVPAAANPAGLGPAGPVRAVGWVPADLGITAFGDLADNPFGSVGDLRIHADPSTSVPLPTVGAPITLTLGDLRHADGTPWDCCPRTLLRSTLGRLRADTGLTLSAAFEHEFVLSADPDGAPEHPFSVQALVAAEPFGTELVGALTEAGLEPENWLPEFGAHQWEITIRPAEGLAAADRAIALREITRAAARLAGRSASFAPVPPGCAAMNGAHIHFSLWTGDGEPATGGDGYSGLSKTALSKTALSKTALSKTALSFAAGIIDHAAAVLAFTAPSVVSYQRLGPGHWSADGPRLGAADREAMLRVPGLASAPEQTHLEFRAADSTANPWLALGALVRAGLDGVNRALPAPDPEAARPFPESLQDALSALEQDEVMRSWLPADLLRTYLSVKRSEISAVAGLPADQVHARYARAY